MTPADIIAREEDRVCMAILQANILGLLFHDLAIGLDFEYYSLRYKESNQLITAGNISHIEKYLDRISKLKAFL
jgi:hypothetical protein